jgi:FkbM family methyltransferase
MFEILDCKKVLNCKKIIFGASNFGKMWFENLEKNKIKVDYFADNNLEKWGENFCGKAILPLEKLYELDKNNTVIVIASTVGTSDIFEQLRIAGFKQIYIASLDEDMLISNKECKNNLVKLLDKLEEIQEKGGFLVNNNEEVYEPDIYNYFGVNLNVRKYIINPEKVINYIKKVIEVQEMVGDEKSKTVLNNLILFKVTGDRKYLEEIYDPIPYFISDIFQFRDDEVLIDGGSYVGDTVKHFIKFTENKYKKIYTFEPNKYIYSGLKELYRKEDRIVTYNKGIAEKEDILYFSDDGTASRINSHGKLTIETIALDKIIDENVTFIKLDIEGSEIEGLDGARNIIIKNKPKLAICIYHKMDDLWKIPLYIKEIVPEYKIYIRHHRKDSECETVCYATI